MEQLSIIIQGPCLENDNILNKDVIRNAQRTRRTFPNAEIIFSTWNTSQLIVDELTYQLSALNIRLVLSEDPGSIVAEDAAGKYVNNINRMLISTKNGLEHASRPLAVKLRTDSYLHGRQLVPLLENLLLSQDEIFQRNSDFVVFRSRLINCNLYARDARGSLPYLFHPGDIMLAGRTEDVNLFFSAPLVSNKIFQPAQSLGLWSAWQYVPEQWCWLHAIYNITGKWVYAGNFMHSPADTESSEQWFIANFIPYSSKQLGFAWQKYWRCYAFRGLFSVYTYSTWLNLILKHQDSTLPRKKYLVVFVRRCLVTLWRIGYCLRVYILKLTFIRKLAILFFSSRNY